MDRYTVIIADENRLFVEGLKCLLGKYEGRPLTVVDSISNGEDLHKKIDIFQPDLLITEIKLPERDGIDLLPIIREENPGMRILVISNYRHSKFVKNAFHSGTDGYILKSNTLEELYEALDEVVAGNTYMGKGVTIAPSRRGRIQKNDSSWELEDAFLLKNHLTKRELEILTQIALAKNNKEIAKELFISDQTVSVHRKNIMRKLNVSNTASLIKIALDHGLVT